MIDGRKIALLTSAGAAAAAALVGSLWLTGNSVETSHPATAASLRRYIDSLEAGKPNYEEMSLLLADTVRQQLPQIETLIHRMGALQSMAYKGVDADGMDLYDVTFEHGQLEWRIGPLTPDGRVLRRGFRTLP